jgi:UDP-glucose 4-epimerase
LPLASLKGRRSILSLDNLVVAIAKVLGAPAPLRRPFIVADPDPLTIPEMLAAMRGGLGRRPGLLPFPGRLLDAGLRIAGRREDYQRLAGSLVAHPAALQKLGWSPAIATRDALAELMRVD